MESNTLNTGSETIGEVLVDAAVDQQIESKDVQTVGEFTDGVEENVKGKVDQLRDVFGDQVEAIAGPVMEEVASYAGAKRDLYREDFEVQDTQAEGAAAWFDTNSKKISVGLDGMERTANEEYWGRVSEHEQVHEKDQAIEFNLDKIWYPGDTVEVNPTLVEWQAITDSGQPDSDLTPDYREHKERGDALVAYLGSDKPLREALKTGDMEALQQAILKKELEDPNKLETVLRQRNNIDAKFDWAASLAI